VERGSGWGVRGKKGGIRGRGKGRKGRRKGGVRVGVSDEGVVGGGDSEEKCGKGRWEVETCVGGRKQNGGAIDRITRGERPE